MCLLLCVHGRAGKMHTAPRSAASKPRSLSEWKNEFDLAPEISLHEDVLLRLCTSDYMIALHRSSGVCLWCKDQTETVMTQRHAWSFGIEEIETNPPCRWTALAIRNALLICLQSVARVLLLFGQCAIVPLSWCWVWWGLQRLPIKWNQRLEETSFSSSCWLVTLLFCSAEGRRHTRRCVSPTSMWWDLDHTAAL